MNIINETLIDLLISAAETLRNETCRILQSYRTKRDYEHKIAERYKDENAYFQQEQSKLASIARDDITRAEKAFSAKVEEYTGKMEEQLKKHLSMPVNSQFREKLSMLADFGIQPEKIEIDDLISLNGGNQIGLTALAKTLEKVNSPYKLKYHTTADYQADIGKIRNLAVNLKYIPNEYHSEGCEIYKGIYADLVLPNGRVIGNGINYDSVSLLTNAVVFENTMKEIQGFKDIWSADCSYSEADNADETESNPESGTTVEESNSEGIKVAKQLGRDSAKAQENYNRIVKEGQML